MTKQIEDLVPDIYKLIEEGLTEGDYQEFGQQSSQALERGLRPRDGQEPARVWFSNAGHPCVRKLWYKVNEADKAVPLRPHTRIKFLYGDLLEGLLLDLARRAGHLVEHEQERVELDGITGRIDAIINGVLVDVKSASSYSFKKFESGLQRDDDAFGYLGQLQGYLLAARTAGWCEGNRAAFLAINKETGKLCLDVHEFSDNELAETAAELVGRKLTAEDGSRTPDRAFEPIPEGKSGNLKLGVNCSYCEFNAHCHKGLRAFLYSRGPVFLTHVERTPDVPELEWDENENMFKVPGE